MENLSIKWKEGDKGKEAFIYFDLMVPNNTEANLLINFEKQLETFKQGFEAVRIESQLRVFEYRSIELIKAASEVRAKPIIDEAIEGESLTTEKTVLTEEGRKKLEEVVESPKEEVSTPLSGDNADK